MTEGLQRLMIDPVSRAYSRGIGVPARLDKNRRNMSPLLVVQTRNRRGQSSQLAPLATHSSSHLLPAAPAAISILSPNGDRSLAVGSDAWALAVGSDVSWNTESLVV